MRELCGWSKIDQKTKRWRAARKRAARRIDPATAVAVTTRGQIVDPYGIYRTIPDELNCIGKNIFVRSPRGKIWVWDGDLPEAVYDALWKRLETQSAEDD